MPIKFVLDGAVLAEMLRSPLGMLGRHMIERGEIVRQAAKAQVRPHSKTGCLEGSIVKRVEEYGDSFAIRIISDTTPCSPSRKSYSLYFHEGTQPHTITAKNGVLAFFWANGPEGAGTYFYRSVKHPGTKPVRFLSDNLKLFT